MTWGDKPRCNVKMNEDVEAVVVKIEDGQVMLSTKRLENNPWNSVKSRYKVGSQLKVSVVNITDIGAFVELEPGLRGLIHKKQLSFGLVKILSVSSNSINSPIKKKAVLSEIRAACCIE